MLRYFIQRVHKRRLLAKPRVVVCVPSRHHRRRAARGRGGHDRRGQPSRLHHRGADGRRDRRRAPDPRAHRQHGRRHRRRHDRGRGDLARRHRHVDRRSASAATSSTRRSSSTSRRSTRCCSASARPRRSSSRSRSVFPMPEELVAEIKGRDLVSGLPKTITISAEEIRRAIEEPVNAIIDAIKTTLDRTPPELCRRHHGPRHRPDRRRRAAARAWTSGCATRPACRSASPTRRCRRSCSARASAWRSSRSCSGSW